MKRLRKLLLLCSTLILCCTLCFAIACEGDDSSSPNSPVEGSTPDSTSPDESSSSPDEESSSPDDEEETAAYMYRVVVETVGGYGLRDVSVGLYDGETLVAEKKTTSAGFATFKEEDIATAGEYTIVLDDLPAGYALADDSVDYKTETEIKTKTNIALMPQGVIKEAVPSGKSYRLGDVMYDFTVTTSDDQTFTLSEVLKEKKAVLLNFWATWCNPCKMEFPVMNSAYYEYRNDVSILAMSTTDTMAAVAQFKTTSGLTFDMTERGESLTTLFNTSAIPTSVLIDRYGVISFYHSGSMTSKRDFTDLFDKFIADDYQPTILSDGSSINPDGDDSQEDNMVLPDIADPDTADVEAALGASSAFSAEWDTQDAYSWPWLISENNDYIYSPNKFAYSYSTLKINFEVTAPTALTFEYLISSEEKADILYVLIDGTIIHQLSGIESDWKTCYADVFDEDDYGSHQLILIYMKDDSLSAGDDMAKVRNLKFTSVEELDSPNVDANIFRYAATKLNEDANATTQYKTYITPVYNEDDGYYHVNEKDGAILFANMMFPSLWNSTSVWILAYEGYCVADGNNLIEPIEAHSWVASNNMTNNGYTPVTRDLRRLLELVVKNVEIGQLWDGENHANEWLEVCVYYQHYGQTPEMADPTETISFHAAKPLQEGSNMVNIPFAMKPRGFKYSFTPTKSGVYNVYSTGSIDTACFLVDEDQETFLGSYDEQIGVLVDSTDEHGNPIKIADTNFKFYYYFEADRTYYMLMTTYLDMTATYEVKIDYMGETYSYFTNAATGPYSANLTTFELYIPDAIDYYYSDPAQGGDGYYHEKESGNIIYLDCNRVTAFFPYNSLKDICEKALELDDDFNFVYQPEDRAFYIGGVDYTPAMYTVCNNASNNEGALRGFIAVDQEIFELLNTITRSNKYEGIQDSWLMLCYYYKNLGPSA